MPRCEGKLRALARSYAVEELHWESEVEVYGFQADPIVRGTGAVWLRRADGFELGLVVNAGVGVLTEFDPDLDGEPGELS